jgi:hypothetical protein
MKLELAGAFSTLSILCPSKPRSLLTGPSFVDDRAKRIVDAGVDAGSGLSLQPVKQVAGLGGSKIANGVNAERDQITFHRWANVHERSQPRLS